MHTNKLPRCEWAGDDPQMIAYHDLEWGVPVHNDRELFELLVLEGAQAGLSWTTILKRRDGYRTAFENFDPKIISKYNDTDIERLLEDKSIIRNKLKIKSTINNAKRFIEIQSEFDSFDQYLWDFINHKPIQNKFKALSELPSFTPLSKDISNDLKKRGFTFIGPTICYAFMQSIGMVNDHLIHCFRYHELNI
ncbi:DNA-3-methyladenine glycosylase I [Candidatus Hodarchaeum mangrovi]